MAGESTRLAPLRRQVVAHCLRRHATIDEAVAALGFVQADPIRAPARAQDLILGQRVDGYRAGDLERDYPRLEVSEEMLHVYGFLWNGHLPLVQPRTPPPYWQAYLDQHPDVRAAVLRELRRHGPSLPRTLEDRIGERRGEPIAGRRVVNAWGGQSSAVTMVLEALQRAGKVQVAARRSGQRVYQLASPPSKRLPLARRTEGLALLVASLYGPLPEPSLRSTLAQLTRQLSGDARQALGTLLRRGALRRDVVDGVAWISPEAAAAAPPVEEERVRLLAPFDPVVWDRRRFELLWGWAYRFEAYTPVAKRKLGYYALPLLFGDRVIGWANVARRGSGALDVTTGFVAGRPREARFRRELDEELDRLRWLLSNEARGGEEVGEADAD